MIRVVYIYTERILILIGSFIVMGQEINPVHA